MSKQPQDSESRHADKYILRLPDGMRDRLKRHAEANKRTLNAEIVARLDMDLERAANGSSTRELDSHVAAATARSEMLSMRVDLIKTRLDGLYMRTRLIQSDTERMTKEAKTDEDFARVEESVEQLDAVQAEVRSLREELEVVLRDRAVVSRELDQMRAMVASARLELEQRIDAGRKAVAAGNLGSGQSPYDEVARERPIAAASKAVPAASARGHNPVFLEGVPPDPASGEALPPKSLVGRTWGGPPAKKKP